MIQDENLAIERVLEMIKNHKVKTISGKEIEIEADSICVHGDSPKALEFVKKIRSSLETEGIKVVAMGK